MRWSLPLFLLAAMAGCDAAPEPPGATNPYDPRYGDGRLPSPVEEIRLESASPTSVVLAWDDPSSFESRFIVQSAVDYGARPPSSAFRSVAFLDPNTTTLSLEFEPAVGYVSYRVITFADGDYSPPSPSIRIHQPGSYDFSNLAFGFRDVHPSVDGEWVYTNGGASVQVWNPRSGESTGLHSGVDAFIGTLASGDDVLFAANASLRSSPLVARVRVVDGSQVRREVSLQGVPAFTPEAATESGVRVSTDGSRVVALDGGNLGAWSLATGDRVGTVSGLGGVYLRSVSGDGRLALVSTNDGLALADLETGQVRWRTQRYETGLISPDASLLLGGRYSDRGVETVDLQTGEPIGILEASAGRPMEPIGFDVTGTLVAVGVRKVERHYIDVYRVSDLSVVRETRVLSPSDRVNLARGYSVRILDGADRIGSYNFRTASAGYIEVLDYVGPWQVAP